MTGELLGDKILEEGEGTGRGEFKGVDGFEANRTGEQGTIISLVSKLFSFTRNGLPI